MTDFSSPPERFAGSFWHQSSATDRVLPPLASESIDPDTFALLADNIPALCWIARGDGYIVWYNRRWHEYCGTTPEAMEGWGWQSVHDPNELPKVLERWALSIERGAPFEMVFPLRGADGAFRPFLTRVAPFRDASGAVVRWFGSNTEIGAQMRAEDAQARAEAALSASEAKYNVLTEAMPQMVWSTLPDGYHDYYNRQWYEFTGVPVGSTDGEEWNGMFHPDDQERAWARWRHSLATGEPYEIEYRLRHRSGDYRWTLGRALPVRDDSGRIVRWIGTCTDIHSAKMASDLNEVLTRELSHRIKNIFAIVASLIRLSIRREPGAEQFGRDLLDRVRALGRAHEFARPHSEDSQPMLSEGMLQGLLQEILRPYRQGEIRTVDIAGADVPVDDKAATPLALLFHELATNAVKYGSLSDPDGRVAIDIKESDDDQVMIVWCEKGGPQLSGPPDREGFGSRLAMISVQQQLGGTIERKWLPDGLRVDVRIKRTSLVRET